MLRRRANSEGISDQSTKSTISENSASSRGYELWDRTRAREHKSFDSRTSLRNYTTADNDPLREALAAKDGVGPDQVFLRSGSGHILKQVVPWLIKKEIKSSKARIFRHLVAKNGFPIITPRLKTGRSARYPVSMSR